MFSQTSEESVYLLPAWLASMRTQPGLAANRTDKSGLTAAGATGTDSIESAQSGAFFAIKGQNNW